MASCNTNKTKQIASGREMHGRKKIMTDVLEINRGNVQAVLQKSYNAHLKNRSEIDYLWKYYKGIQPILEKSKDVRPEINNRIVENHASQIVAFKTGYFCGEPIQYVLRSADEQMIDAINLFNEFMFAEGKPEKDREISDWMHICGVGVRMVLPDNRSEEDEAPFEVYTLDPRNAYVVYANDVGEPPVMGVKYVVKENNSIVYSVYTKDTYFEIADGAITREESHILGDIPIIEYCLNPERMGAFEPALPLLDAINTVDSDRLDGVDQFIQALMLFHNVNITGEQFDELRDRGVIRITDVSDTKKGDVRYLISEMNQSQTQTLKDDLYTKVLEICGMPNQNIGSSDTGSAVILRNGWSEAESRAKGVELMFKMAERAFIRIALRICNTLRVDMEVLRPGNIEPQFTRRNYENIQSKSQVLISMLQNDKIHPKLAFEHSGMFADPERAYAESVAYWEEQKAQETPKEPER